MRQHFLELPKRLPSFQAVARASPTAGTRRGPGRGPTAGLSHLSRFLLWAKLANGEKQGGGGGAGHGQSLLWARCWVVPKSKKLRTQRGQGGEERGFSGSFAPQSAKQSFLASPVSDCTSSLFVWDKEGPLGPGGHRHMSLRVCNRSGIGGHSQGVERLQIWSLWHWKGI